MLSSVGMEQSSEKNFLTLISLMLLGLGASLVLLPEHVGVRTHNAVILWHNLTGVLCFLTALGLQLFTMVAAASWKKNVIKVMGGVLLIISGTMLYTGGQKISSILLMISGGIMFITIIPWAERFQYASSFHWGIVTLSFFAGLGLLFSIQASGSIIPALLVALFFITAFFSAVTIIVPEIKFGRLAQKSQILPWIGLWVVTAMMGMDNLIVPTAIIIMLLVERNIPWSRLIISRDDILSRRVVMIAAFVELSNLIFMGALLNIVMGGEVSVFTFTFTPRQASFVFFILSSAVLYYASITVVITTNGLIYELNKTADPHWDEENNPHAEEAQHWTRRLERYLRPFVMSAEGIRRRVQTDQIQMLSRQFGMEKNRNTQLLLLLELSQQLESQLDQPVSAQIAANMLERTINCGMISVLLHNPEEKNFTLLASAGKHAHIIPAGYQQTSSLGVVGRALRQRKTQIVGDCRLDTDFVAVSEKENSLSFVVVPLIFNGHIHGVITLGSETTNAFASLEVGLAESVAAELVRSWERSGYHQRLKGLIQTGSQLSSAPDPEATAREVAAISREVTEAKYSFIYVKLGQDQSYILRTSSGYAPSLQKSLMGEDDSSELFDLVLHTSQPFRVRDIRKYERTSHLTIDNPGLRSMLVIPIRWHNTNIGAIFSFGKQNEVFFTENDESLAELIAIQAGGAFESTWLQQELRTSLRVTSLLYRLSNQIIQSENIGDAAFDIAETAHKLSKNITTGIVLFDQYENIIAEVQVNDSGKMTETDHPIKMVHDSIQTGQMIHLAQGKNTLRSCMPIQTPIRSYGAVWMDTFDDPSKPAVNPNDLQALVTQAAIALERSLFLVESRRQANEIREAYDMLEKTYDQTLAALTSALDARDRETEGHSMRVTKLAVKLGETLGYSTEQLKILERGSILHDIGKIGISDSILHKPGPLNEEEWKIMRLHPGIGARIVKGIPFLEDTIELIECHQERWDGSGYPFGYVGEDIPELARLFSVIDAFDALTSICPYRQKISKNEALEYLKEQAGISFDPAMVEAFANMMENHPAILKEIE